MNEKKEEWEDISVPKDIKDKILGGTFEYHNPEEELILANNRKSLWKLSVTSCIIFSIAILIIIGSNRGIPDRYIISILFGTHIGILISLIIYFLFIKKKPYLNSQARIDYQINYYKKNEFSRLERENKKRIEDAKALKSKEFISDIQIKCSSVDILINNASSFSYSTWLTAPIYKGKGRIANIFKAGGYECDYLGGHLLKVYTKYDSILIYYHEGNTKPGTATIHGFYRNTLAYRPTRSWFISILDWSTNTEKLAEDYNITLISIQGFISLIYGILYTYAKPLTFFGIFKDYLLTGKREVLTNGIENMIETLRKELLSRKDEIPEYTLSNFNHHLNELKSKYENFSRFFRDEPKYPEWFEHFRRQDESSYIDEYCARVIILR